jgi:hypothetical protein
MGRRKKSLVVNPNPPKRRAANRRKAKRSPVSEMYAAQEQERSTVRSRRPRKVSASKRKRSGGAVKERGKRVAPAKAVNRRRA